MNAISAHTVAAVDYDRYARLYIAARAGDRSAQRTLIEELNVPLWRVARKAGLDAESAADVVQTAWLRLWRTKDGLNQPRALTKWLHTTVSREAWNVAGRAKREVVSDPLDIKEPVIEGIEDDLVRSAEREAVRRAFLAQDVKCRALLAYVAAFARPDYDVISEELGMKRGSIGPTRGRCLDKLRKTLMDDPSWASGEERDADGT
ncbi:RNA polymerase sigma factor [Glycomyces albidus]|jgi:RNA polymerase sigma factor (sigma-70 family)|uniref:Sigma-70 family RNA polymerase sigma factor n=1 Tax=Glycomyces albidus TaxID=2656774 RepID=A0A6L5GDF9_9ACTN|nr:sigma-70 family RNA polymerase sigma factor [Glycomyces albidus]MQM27503.1 sigma-70 family RNA polymerase sigma factor [Glycomyces albidus]